MTQAPPIKPKAAEAAFMARENGVNVIGDNNTTNVFHIVGNDNTITLDSALLLQILEQQKQILQLLKTQKQ